MMVIHVDSTNDCQQNSVGKAGFPAQLPCPILWRFGFCHPRRGTAAAGDAMAGCALALAGLKGGTPKPARHDEVY